MGADVSAARFIWTEKKQPQSGGVEEKEGGEASREPDLGLGDLLALQELGKGGQLIGGARRRRPGLAAHLPQRRADARARPREGEARVPEVQLHGACAAILSCVVQGRSRGEGGGCGSSDEESRI